MHSCQHVLKIHQARMKVLVETRYMQRREATETHKGPNQGSHPIPQNIQGPVNATPSTLIRNLIKWPLAYDKNAWNSFDEDVSEILRTTLKGGAGRRLRRTMSIIIFSCAAEIFGLVKEKKDFNKTEPQRNTNTVIKARSYDTLKNIIN